MLNAAPEEVKCKKQQTWPALIDSEEISSPFFSLAGLLRGITSSCRATRSVSEAAGCKRSLANSTRHSVILSLIE